MSTPRPALAGLALVALFLPTIGAHADVSAPVSLGLSQVDAPYGRLAPEPSTRTISVKTSREVPQEGSILVASLADVLSGDILTRAGCSDSAGNTYHVDVARFSGVSGENAIVCSTHGIAALWPFLLYRSLRIGFDVSEVLDARCDAVQCRSQCRFVRVPNGSVLKARDANVSNGSEDFLFSVAASSIPT